MALGTFVAGRYVGQYTPPQAQAADLGLVEKGYTITVTHYKDVIRDTDGFADIELDSVHRGMNCYAQLNCKEWKAGPLIAAFQYSHFEPTGSSIFGPGSIGILGSSDAGSVNLSAIGGTPAESSPASLAIGYADIMEGFNIEWLMGPEHRKLPMRFRMLLYSSGSEYIFFTTT